ncbi:hypothetical protein GCM10009662_46790 [Catellatospora coxensis]|uniref:Uncharacterized protein n=1 Tax=Catellatospora coxensis TaxID=310354 RepID=A0A8J3KT58_9ACTN|nr:hypothetical protein Cco03nite_24580 [Catellatospora coxensis]
MPGAEGDDVIVRMWEVRAYPRTFTELLNWVCEEAVPRLEVEPLHITSEVFSSTDLRVVVISRWRGEPRPLADPPEGLAARSPHVWDFAPVDR